MARKERRRFGLLSHLDKLMDELHDNVPKAIREFDVDGIHDARVATRRLKAALGCYKGILSDDHRTGLTRCSRRSDAGSGPLRDWT